MQLLSQLFYIGQLQMFVDIILQLKKTNTLNIISAELAPSLPMARVYYFRELNCNNVELAWDIDRVIENLNTLSVMIYQELTTDIQGNPN